MHVYGINYVAIDDAVFETVPYLMIDDAVEVFPDIVVPYPDGFMRLYYVDAEHELFLTLHDQRTGLTRSFFITDLEYQIVAEFIEVAMEAQIADGTMIAGSPAEVFPGIRIPHKLHHQLRLSVDDELSVYVEVMVPDSDTAIDAKWLEGEDLGVIYYFIVAAVEDRLASLPTAPVKLAS